MSNFDIREMISNLYEGSSTSIDDEVIRVTHNGKTVSIDCNLPVTQILSKLESLLI